MSGATAVPGILVPPRLDRLPWSSFHRRVVMALGVSWILDGLQVTLFGSLAGAIQENPGFGLLGLSEPEIGFAASAYLLGAVTGALGFGWWADRWGRRRLFFITLTLYMLASIATGCAWDFGSFLIFRALTGAGIGGEYAAINSAIQELVPARRRGAIDLAVNGSFWVGAMLGASISLVLLHPAVINPGAGWRFAFGISGALSLIVLFLRRFLPESPRWLVINNRAEEADHIVTQMEREVEARHGALPPLGYAPVVPRWRGHVTLQEIWEVLSGSYRSRALLGLVLMSCQAFFYNAVFFTYALVLMRVYAIPARDVGWFILPLAMGNLLGPLLLGRWFDTVGRKRMIVTTYGVSGLLVTATSIAFGIGWLSAWPLTAAWTLIFFFASAAASAAYLTVGEGFPLQMRAVAIALFYAVGTAAGGLVGPPLLGWLIKDGNRTDIMWGYLLAAMLMLTAAATEWRFGFAAERKPLEEVAPPLEIGRIRLKTGDGRPFMIVLLFATIGAWLASGFDGVSAIGGALIGMAAGVFLSWYLEAGSAPG